MIEVSRLLEAVREELRTTVLGRIQGDYERSVVIAMLGILRDLRDMVVLDEAPVAAEAARLHEVCRQSIAELGDHALAPELAARVATAERMANVTRRRDELAAAVEILVRELWRLPELAGLRRSLLPRVRAAFKS